MQSPLYVALSSQIALQRRMDTIAHNIANAGSVGYRAGRISFESMVSTSSSGTTAYVSAGETTISQQAGALVRTGAPLDVAIRGDGFIGIQTPSGLACTRDGRLQMSNDGTLQTVTGYRVVDAGGAAIQLDPTGGTPGIARDGMITQGGNQIAAIGLFSFPVDQKFDRYGDAALVTKTPPVSILEFSRSGFEQGFVEQSNVDPTRQLVELMTVSRTFQGAQAMIDQTERKQSDGLRILGGTK